MAKHGTRFTITLPDGKKHRMPAYRWREWVDRKWIVRRAESTNARLAEGYHIRFDENGNPGLYNSNRVYMASIPSSWAAVERARVYSPRGIRESAERQRAIQEMCAPATIKNEIVIKRQFE